MTSPEQWSAEDAATARLWGWALCDVYDLTKKSLSRQLLPAQFTETKNAASTTFKFVSARAQAGDALAKKALKFVMQGPK